MEPKELAAIYHKYHKGDPLTDRELAYAIPLLEAWLPFYHDLGERFFFFWKEMRELWEGLTSYRDARRRT